jgi:general secretion pathway protein G
MMVVLFIIGLIVAMIGPRIGKMMRSGNVTSTEALLKSVKNALAEYEVDTNTKAKTLEHLVRNVDSNPKWQGPYLSGKTEVSQLVDGWGNMIIFNRPPKIFTKEFQSYEVISYGVNGEAAEVNDYLKAGE